MTAYSNLENQGIIKTLKGKGTFICTEKKETEKTFIVNWKEEINYYGNICTSLDITKTELHCEKGMISFKSIAPDEKLFDIEEFKRAFLNIFSLEGEKLLNYGYAQGYKPLINYIKNYMSKKGVNTKGKDILITNGFTEGFDILLTTLIKKGDFIACEEPTHNTALKIIKAHGINIMSIPMDKDGINTTILEESFNKNKPKFLYTIPSYHNPTGIVISGKKRKKIYEICEKYSVPILEDGFNEELLYSSSPVPPIASLCINGTGVIYIGSFSKVLFPGLRIGWILADKNLINTLESVKRAKNIHSSFLDQAVLFKYLESGAFDRYMKKIRKYYRDKYNFTLEQIKKYIPHKLILGEGGLHIFIKLKGVNGREVLERCYKKGVIFMPGDIFYNGDEGKECIRIGFSRVKEKDIEKGIKIIGDVIKDLKKT